nr:MAG TPA: hypothetical protein [Caudoviricetes sp.]
MGVISRTYFTHSSGNFVQTFLQMAISTQEFRLCIKLLLAAIVDISISKMMQTLKSLRRKIRQKNTQ